MKRRDFFKLVGAVGATAVTGQNRAVASEIKSSEDTYAVLHDLTLCVGCRSCESACAEQNELPEPEDDDRILDSMIRSTSETQFTVVNRFDTSAGDVYVKRQCMHCNTPACSSACLTKAMLKTEEGPVIWREDKCMGCRFCMVSCPFDMPKYEYHSAMPKVQKCRMCWERLQAGEIPACVEECPEEAAIFGKRSELLEIARQRIYENPGNYVPHIYGEHEAGGTGWLYLSSVPFEEIGFRTDLGETAYPEYSRQFLTAVPVVLIMWPAFLLALRQATAPEQDEMLESAKNQTKEV